MAYALGCAVMSAAGSGSTEAQTGYSRQPVRHPDVPSSQETQQDGRGKSGTTRITLTMRDSTLSSILNALSKQSGRPIVYDHAHREFTARTSVRIVDLDIKAAVAVALKGTRFQATVAPDGETIIVRPAVDSSTGRNAQTRAQNGTGTVSGIVVDSATGNTIGGARIEVVGAALSTVVDDRGTFLLRGVPAGEQMLSVRLFGFRSLTRPVTVAGEKTTALRLVLSSIPTTLAGVVTTAAGLQRRLEVGNDVSVLNVDSIMRNAPVATVTDLLATRIPGLVVLPSSGQPGSPSQIRLRGSSSITRSNDPIVIVDGVRVFADQFQATSGVKRLQAGIGAGGYNAPSPLDQIDPNSISTIEVFKGPSASALYGSDAANGVIIVTTKRGTTNRARWDIVQSNGRSQLPGHWPANLYRFGQKPILGGEGICGLRPGETACLTDSIVSFQALNNPRLTAIGRGHTQYTSATVSGRTGSLGYSFTGSLGDETGILKLPEYEKDQFRTLHGFDAPGWMRRPDRYRTASGSSALDFPVGAGGTLMLSSRFTNSQKQESSLQTAMTRLQSNYIDTLSLGVIPLIESYYERVRLRTLSVSNALTATYPVRAWLPLNATAGFDVRQTENNGVLPQGYLLGSDDSIGRYQTSRGSAINQTLTVGTTLTTRGRGRLPSFSAPLGFNVLRQSQSTLNGRADGIPAGVMEPSKMDCNPSRGPCQSQEQLSQATYGWYLTPRFTIGDRIFVNPGLRFDGGTASGSNARYTPFPKVDLSWIAVDRPEQPMFGVIALARPRIAFGIAGVQPRPGDQLRLMSLTTESASGSSTVVSVARLASMGNTLLRPERSREFEGGIDIETRDQRVALSLSGYRKMRFDAIVPISFAPSVTPTTSGTDRFTSSQNIGTIKNSGFEGSLSARIIDHAMVAWSMNGNIYKNRNTVVSVDPAAQLPNNGRDGRVVAGYPISGRWRLPLLGYTDLNRNGRIDGFNELRIGDSLVFMGASEPNYDFSLNTSLALWNGRISFVTTINYQNGMTQESQGTALESRLNDSTLSLAQQALLWKQGLSGNGDARGFVQTVNTLRWTSLSISGQLPQPVTRRLRVTSLQVALQGRNLGLKTNYHGKDPNVNTDGVGGASIRDDGGIPQPRVWQLQVRVGL